MRTHHGTKPNLEWSWEKDAETIEHFRRYAALHIALVPTMTALAAHASETGVPIWRSLALHYPEDTETWGLKDQVLLGDSLIIAPIMEAGKASREVYLPTGQWRLWSTGERLEGGKRVAVAAPITEIPIVARAGAIVPMYPDGVMTLVRGSAEVPDSASVGDDRVVHLVLGENGEFKETNGMSYLLESALVDANEWTATFTPDGGAPVNLMTCDADVPPCVRGIEPLQATVLVQGPGTLITKEGPAVSGTFTMRGGAQNRRTTIRITR
jgi:alpha-glucosidase (family GH31 glycosyl hydrolase)